METLPITHLIISLDDYAVISKDATLYDATQALEDSHEKFLSTWHAHGDSRYKHRAVLISDEKGDIVGRLSQYDMIKGLEPKYDQIGDDERLQRFGISHTFMHEQMQLYGLWQQPLNSICRKAYSILVKDIMEPITNDQYIDVNASINEAIHAFIINKRQLLLVRRKSETIGVIRLTDIFLEVCLTIKSCSI